MICKGGNLASPTQYYEDTIRKFSSQNVITLDPLRFNGDMTHDMESLKEQFKEQFAKTLNTPEAEVNTFIDEWFANPNAQPFFEMTINNSLNLGEYALFLGTDANICIINGVNESAASAQDYIASWTGQPVENITVSPEQLKPLIDFVAKHEVTHCHGKHGSEESPSESPLDVLRMETEADLVGLESVARETAVIVMHIRGLTTSSSATHATSATLLSGINPKEIQQEIYDAAETFKDAMNDAVNEVINSSDIDKNSPDYKFATIDLASENPKLYYQVVESLIQQGTFDHNPHIKPMLPQKWKQQGRY